jgi:hypothetical protein
VRPRACGSASPTTRAGVEHGTPAPALVVTGWMPASGAGSRASRVAPAAWGSAAARRLPTARHTTRVNVAVRTPSADSNACHRHVPGPAASSHMLPSEHDTPRGSPPRRAGCSGVSSWTRVPALRRLARPQRLDEVDHGLGRPLVAAPPEVVHVQHRHGSSTRGNDPGVPQPVQDLCRRLARCRGPGGQLVLCQWERDGHALALLAAPAGREFEDPVGHTICGRGTGEPQQLGLCTRQLPPHRPQARRGHRGP